MRLPLLNLMKKKMDKEKRHFRWSMYKSVLRILGYALLPVDLITAMSLLLFSEVCGIVEEF